MTAPVATLLGAGPIGGCVIGAIALGAIGSLAGTSAGGLGAVIGNAGQFIQLLNAPPAVKK